MPMVLMNTPATLMHTMNNLFLDILDSGIVLFLDNILVYSCTIDEHFMLLEKVPVLLCQYTFYCKLKKCSSLHKKTMLLGFNFMPEGMCISDLKVQSLRDCPVPTTVK